MCLFIKSYFLINFKLFVFCKTIEASGKCITLELNGLENIKCVQFKMRAAVSSIHLFLTTRGQEKTVCCLMSGGVVVFLTD